MPCLHRAAFRFSGSSTDRPARLGATPVCRVRLIGRGSAFRVAAGVDAATRNAAFNDLARFRSELHLPPADNKAGQNDVLARLDVGGGSFYGINSGGADHPGLNTRQLLGAKHAEWDAFGQANDAFPNGVDGGTTVLYVDSLVPCGFRRRNFGGWADQLGLDALVVLGPDGYQGVWKSDTGQYATLS